MRNWGRTRRRRVRILSEGRKEERGGGMPAIPPWLGFEDMATGLVNIHVNLLCIIGHNSFSNKTLTKPTTKISESIIPDGQNELLFCKSHWEERIKERLPRNRCHGLKKWRGKFIFRLIRAASNIYWNESEYHWWFQTFFTGFFIRRGQGSTFVFWSQTKTLVEIWLGS